MSRIDYNWHSGPPPAPDVYTTRRNEAQYLTPRYWDGESWYEIGGPSRGGISFKWPRPSRTRRPEWMRSLDLRLRKISPNLGEIQWGEPFHVFGPGEVLKHLVKTGVLPGDWEVRYQDEMRSGPTPGTAPGAAPGAEKKNPFTSSPSVSAWVRGIKASEVGRRNGERATKTPRAHIQISPPKHQPVLHHPAKPGKKS